MSELKMWDIRPFIYYTLQSNKGEVIKTSRDLTELKKFRNTLENKSDYKLYEHIKG